MIIFYSGNSRMDALPEIQVASKKPSIMLTFFDFYSWRLRAKAAKQKGKQPPKRGDQIERFNAFSKYTKRHK